MRALVLSIVLLVGCQKPNEIANSTDSEIVLESITNSIGMKLVLIPAGTFTMGSPMEEVGRGPDETQHDVTISKPYYLGAYEVTQSEFDKVMGTYLSGSTGSTNPLEIASWDDAVYFCRKLSELTEEKVAGREYRLPTEAEWEYACRAGSKTADSLTEYAWFKENSGKKSHPVGLKKPNRWGLYDMHGNVVEWSQDVYGLYPSGAATDPQGPILGSYRVFRGGGWFDIAGQCRSAVRHGNDPSLRIYSRGFRVAMSPSVKL